MVLIVAMHQPVPLPAEYLRALANLFGLAAMLALRCGVRLFIAAPLPTGAHALAFVIVLVVSWLGLTPECAALRVSVDAAVLAAIALAIAADLYRYGRPVRRRGVPGTAARCHGRNRAASGRAPAHRAGHRRPTVEGATLLLSASIGIAQWREPAGESSRLLTRADAALYQAKLRGRDRVVVDASETEPITLAGGR